MQNPRSCCGLCNGQVYKRQRCIVSAFHSRLRSRTVLNLLHIHIPTVQGYGSRWPWSQRRLAGGWFWYVRDAVQRYRSAQHSVIGRGSSCRSDDVPTNLPIPSNDQRLTGSSLHDTHPQESELTSPIHAQDPTLLPYSKLPEYPFVSSVVYERPVGQCINGDRAPRSGFAFSNSWLNSSQVDYVQIWSNGQTANAQNTMDMTRYYPPPHGTPGGPSVEDRRHIPTSSSPFYLARGQANLTVQPASNRPYSIQYSGDRRASFPQLRSQTPQQPSTYSSLSSPLSDPSYSHPESSPLQLGRPASLPGNLQWPLSQPQSNRSVSDPTLAARHSYYPDSQPQVQFPVPDLSGNPGPAPSPVSLVQLPSSFGDATPYQAIPSYPPGGDPSFPFPVPQIPPQRAQVKRKKEAKSPYSQSGRKKGKASPAGEPPVASSSSVTLDMSPPPAASNAEPKDTTRVSASTQGLRINADQCI